MTARAILEAETPKKLFRILHPEKEPGYCPHLSGYWIDEEAGRFRCYDCNYQVFLDELSPVEQARPREIEHWDSDDDWDDND